MLAERLAVVAGFGHTVVSEECGRLVRGLVTESVDTELPAQVYSRIVCTDAGEILLEDLLAQDELGGVGSVASLEVTYELLKRVVLRVDLLRWRADDERGQHMVENCIRQVRVVKITGKNTSEYGWAIDR